MAFLLSTTALPFFLFQWGAVLSGWRREVKRVSDVWVTVRNRAGHIGNLGEIPDEGGRGQECVTPGLPCHDCILPATP